MTFKSLWKKCACSRKTKKYKYVRLLAKSSRNSCKGWGENKEINEYFFLIQNIIF